MPIIDGRLEAHKRRLIMYLVLLVQNNRVNHVKAFNEFSEAASFADDMVMDLFGVSRVGTWENNSYRNVYEVNGKAVMLEPCYAPGEVDESFKSNKYGVNLR
jgi:hypothetical protein